MRIAKWLPCVLLVTAPALGGVITVAPGQSIQAAIDAAAVGDTVLVAPGTYHEALVIESRSITLAAQGGAAQTVLDATGTGASAIRVAGFAAADTVIDGFTIRGGLGSPIPWVTDRAGGGLLVIDASPLVWECTFVANAGANRGGGAFAYGTALSQHAAPRFHDCTFLDNEAGEGGGYADLNASARFLRCRFERNKAQSGAAIASSGAGDLRVDRCAFLANEATLAGGALHVTVFGPSRASITRSCIVDCSALTSGGAIAVFGLPPLWAGGGVRIENTLIAHNRAFYGGGVSATETGELGMPLVQIVGSTIVDNLALGNSGGGVSTAGGTVAQASIVRSIVQGNLPADLLAFGFFADNCVGARTPGSGNYVADPAFVDRAQRDYHLNANSPCRDRGSSFPGSGLDLDGNPRVGGAAIDTGADEFAAHAYFATCAGGTLDLRAVGEPGAPVLVFFAPTPKNQKPLDPLDVIAAIEPVATSPLLQGAVGPFALGVLDASGALCVKTRKLAPTTALSMQAVLGAALTLAESTAACSLAAPCKAPKASTPGGAGDEATICFPEQTDPKAEDPNAEL